MEIRPYRVEGKAVTHICIEAERKNHYDWAALHIFHTKAEALKAMECYADNDGYCWAKGNARRTGWHVCEDCSICYHTAEGWVCLGEGDSFRISDIRKADAIQCSGSEDQTIWASDESRITVFVMDGFMLEAEIDLGEIYEDCEEIVISDLEERSEEELNVIRLTEDAQEGCQEGAQQAEVLTYEEALRIAKKHYNEGGDAFVECWSEEDYRRSPMTTSQLMSLFRAVADEEADAECYRQEAMSESLSPDAEGEAPDYEWMYPAEWCESDDDDWQPGDAPWKAPGMSVSDFI